MLELDFDYIRVGSPHKFQDQQGWGYLCAARNTGGVGSGASGIGTAWRTENLLGIGGRGGRGEGRLRWQDLPGRLRSLEIEWSRAFSRRWQGSEVKMGIGSRERGQYQQYLSASRDAAGSRCSL